MYFYVVCIKSRLLDFVITWHLLLQDQCTPLYVASTKGFTGIVKLLLAANANVNCICKVSCYKTAHIVVLKYVYTIHMHLWFLLNIWFQTTFESLQLLEISWRNNMSYFFSASPVRSKIRWSFNNVQFLTFKHCF